MNRSFDPLHLVNTYGAFGSVSRIRHEVVVEGTADDRTPRGHRLAGVRVQGQARRSAALPRQFAPYHLRLDWMMWFAALSPAYAGRWFGPFVERLLENDRDTLRLLRRNPFPGRPARVRPRPALPLPVHDLAGTAGDRAPGGTGRYVREFLRPTRLL